MKRERDERQSQDFEDEPQQKTHSIILPKRAQIESSSAPSKQGIIVDQVSSIFKDDYTFLALKPDHHNRPLWVCHDGRIILEAFSQFALQAQDFLITISEPVSRPSRIHEFKLSAYSLYAAVAVGMDTDTIIAVLNRFSKVDVPSQVLKFIKDCTLSYGKVKLVLNHNRYFIESNFPDILRLLLKDDVISKSHLKSTILDVNIADKKVDEFSGAVITLDFEDESEESKKLNESDFASSFEINQEMVEEVKRRAAEIDYPLMEEYDFRNDSLNATLDIDLSPKCLIRDYQEKSLSKMFGGGAGRARSGIIVLPTGAGKTLVGITAACTIKKNTLVLCTNALSVEQWANEFRNWSSIKDGQIAKFTADNKAKFSGKAGIIAHSGKRSWDTQKMLSFINSTEWGLMILDEVHVVPANVFRRVLTTVAAHTKLGLTATLVREDDKIEDLNFLIGPKLYEANWMDLAGKGHIAKVEATEIWCQMTASKPPKRRLLCVMNPTKFMACEYLIRWRESENDKIIVFSDNVFALAHYAKALNKPYLYGGTNHDERTRVLNYFRQGHPNFKTIFLSKVGDTSLDLPEATCLIQISSQFGSRRQEAQRMGRILRAKRRNEEGFRSRFYTLVSRDTDEVAFSSKRKRFLIDQGYEFKVISSVEELIPKDIFPTLHYYDGKSQKILMQKVLDESDEAGEEEIINVSLDDIAGVFQNQLLKKKKTGFVPLTQDEKVKRDKKKEADKKMNPLFKAWLK